jgi:hypothetical protein
VGLSPFSGVGVEAVSPSDFWMAFSGSSVLVLVERRHIFPIALG